MKAYFEGDKSVMVFKPIKKKQRFFKTNEERLKTLSTDDLAKELALIACWDRAQVENARKGTGLVQFMKHWLQQPAKEEK